MSTLCPAVLMSRRLYDGKYFSLPRRLPFLFFLLNFPPVKTHGKDPSETLPGGQTNTTRHLFGRKDGAT